jgi:ABC-type Na+ efflux pump permease subunit
MDIMHVYAVSQKDLKEVFSSPGIYLPMIAIPLLFAIALPAFTVYVSKFAGPALAERLLKTSVPLGSSTSEVFFMQFFLTNVLGPIFMTMPIITASVIAADSFAGEKERKTAESLLSTPITNKEVLLGKILSSFLPAVAMTVIIFFVYAGVANYSSGKYFDFTLLPNTGWFLMLLTSPFLALTTIGLVVLVSLRAKGVKEAQQVSTLLVLPILVIPFISTFGIAVLTTLFFIELLMILAATSAIVLALGIKLFDKERFITA